MLESLETVSRCVLISVRVFKERLFLLAAFERVMVAKEESTASLVVALALALVVEENKDLMILCANIK